MPVVFDDEQQDLPPSGRPRQPAVAGPARAVDALFGDIIRSEGFDAGLGAFTERLTDNVLGIPQILGSAAQEAGNLLQDTPVPALGPVIGEPLSVLGRALNENVPSGREVMATAQGVLTAGGDISSALAARDDLAERNPFVSGVGQFLGDAATIQSGRGPREAAGGLFDEVIDNFITSRAKSVRSTTGGTGAREIKEVLQGDTFRDIARGIGRSVETGLEGTALAMLQGEDPIETGMLAAMLQAGGSAGLTFAGTSFEAPTHIIDAIRKDGKKTGRFTKLAVGVGFQTWLLDQVFSLLGDGPITAEAEAFDKARIAAVVGLATVAAKRSKSDGLLSNFPNLADSLLTVPRTALIGAAQAMAEDQPTRNIVRDISQNPERYTEEELNKIQQGIRDGNIKQVVADNFGSGGRVVFDDEEGEQQ